MEHASLQTLDFVILGLFIMVLYMYLFPKMRRKMRGNVAYMKPDELKRRLRNEEDVLVIDARRAEEFNGVFGHIDGAVNIPVNSIQELLTRKSQELEGFKDTPVIVVGFKDGNDAFMAYNVLKNSGFSNVFILDNGMTAWIKAGFPVKKNK